jgi:outer membrane protein
MMNCRATMGIIAGVATVACLHIAMSTAHAQPAPVSVAPADPAFEQALAALFDPRGLTPADTALRAQKTSPSVSRKDAEVDAAVFAAKKAELVKVPRLGASVGYTRLSEITPPMLAPGVSFPQFFNSYSSNAQVGVPISDYLVRIPAIIDAARLGTEAAKSSQNATRLEVGSQAVTVYYEWIRASVQAVVADRALAQVDATLKIVQAMFDAQRVSRADLLRVQSQRAQTEQMVTQLHMLVALREEQLRMAIGASADERLRIGDDIRIDIAVPPQDSLDELLRKAMAARLDIHTLEVGIAAKTNQIKAEKAGHLPRLSAFAQADFANPNQRVFPQKDDFRFTWSAGLQVSWSFNDYLNTDYTVATIEAENRQYAADRRSIGSGIRLQILAALQGIASAQSAITSSQTGLVAAEEGFRVRSELFSSQRATTAEVIDAQTELTRARGTALMARVDLRLAMAQLAHAVGDDKNTLATKSM